MANTSIISQYVFVDEYGNSDLDVEKEGPSIYYIFAGIFIAPDNIQNSIDHIKRIQKNHFSGSPIKSSGVGKNDERRIDILREITKIDFTYYAFIINKGKLDKASGLQYKESFYKNLHKHFYRQIAEINTDISIIGDTFGGVDFKDSFLKYIETQSKPNLFSRITVSVATPQEIIQIQLADFIAGTLARIYDPNVKSSQHDTFTQLLKPKKIRHEYWPPIYDEENISHFLNKYENNEYDAVIARNAVNQALEYIRKHENDSDELLAMQAEVLQVFLNLRIDEDSKKSVTADEITEHLSRCGFDAKGKQYFTSRIIGGLRDKHMIIAGNNDGYRLALDTSDIADYLKHDSSIIIPMLSRLQKADEKIKGLTSSNLNISKLDDSKLLSKMVDVFSTSEEHRIMDNNELFK
jgi:hypothetical protein